jgi:hypothetical protein
LAFQCNDLYDYKETFHELGVKPDVDFEVLKSVLEHLSQKYQLIEDNSSTEQEDDIRFNSKFMKGFLIIIQIISQFKDVRF